jgi:hypothetical protein
MNAQGALSYDLEVTTDFSVGVEPASDSFDADSDGDFSEYLEQRGLSDSELDDRLASDELMSADDSVCFSDEDVTGCGLEDHEDYSFGENLSESIEFSVNSQEGGSLSDCNFDGASSATEPKLW